MHPQSKNPLARPLVLVFTLALCLTAIALADDHKASDKAVAKVAGKTLTQADLEEFLSEQLAQIELQKAKLFEDGLGPLVEKALLEKAAEEKGLDVQTFMASEIETRTDPITDESVDTWYNANKARLRGQAKEQIAPQIMQFLMQNRGVEAKALVVADLRKKYPVEIFLEPVRIPLSDEQATIKGSADAPITIVEFSDFECPACKGFNPTLTQVMERYGDDVRVVFRQFPLRSIHPKAQKAAEASLCASDQGKFWELHDAMFGAQRKLDVDALKSMAGTLGVDQAAFDQCLDTSKYAAQVQADLDRGAKVGVTGTPAVYINGRVIAPGRVPSLAQMTSVIDEELLRKGKK